MSEFDVRIEISIPLSNYAIISPEPSFSVRKHPQYKQNSIIVNWGNSIGCFSCFGSRWSPFAPYNSNFFNASSWAGVKSFKICSPPSHLTEKDLEEVYTPIMNEIERAEGNSKVNLHQLALWCLLVPKKPNYWPEGHSQHNRVNTPFDLFSLNEIAILSLKICIWASRPSVIRK